MQTFLAVSVGLIALELGVLVLVLVLVGWRAYRAAKAAEALSRHVHEQASSLGLALRTGWLGLGTAAVNIVRNLRDKWRAQK